MEINTRNKWDKIWKRITFASAITNFSLDRIFIPILRKKKKKNRATFFKQTGGSTFITRGVIYGLAHRFELYEIARDFCKRVTKKKQKKIKKWNQIISPLKSSSTLSKICRWTSFTIPVPKKKEKRKKRIVSELSFDDGIRNPPRNGGGGKEGRTFRFCINRMHPLYLLIFSWNRYTILIRAFVSVRLAAGKFDLVSRAPVLSQIRPGIWILSGNQPIRTWQLRGRQVLHVYSPILPRSKRVSTVARMFALSCSPTPFRQDEGGHEENTWLPWRKFETTFFRNFHRDSP